MCKKSKFLYRFIEVYDCDNLTLESLKKTEKHLEI